MKRVNINGRPHDLNWERVDYDLIVTLAKRNPDRVLTVTYTTNRKGDEQRSGSMRKGSVIELEDGMIFDVGDTSNA